MTSTTSRGTRLGITGVHAIVLLFALVPIVYLILVSVSNNVGISTGDLLSSPPQWAAYERVFAETNILPAMLNSVIVAISGAFFGLVLGLPAAWSIARNRATGWKTELQIVSVWVIPPVIGIIPLMILFRTLGLINSIPGLIVLYTFANVPLAVWFLASFLRKIPIELDEAAQLDGAGPLRLFFSIVLPLSVPYLVVVGIITSIFGYHEFLYAVFLAPGEATQTAPVMLHLLTLEQEEDLPKVAAASTVAMIPMFAAAIFLQKWIVGGLTAGAVK